jgi:hypothetical protein
MAKPTVIGRDIGAYRAKRNFAVTTEPTSDSHLDLFIPYVCGAEARCTPRRAALGLPA